MSKCTKPSSLLYWEYTYVWVPAVFTDESFSKRLSSKFNACAMSLLSRFRFLRFSADGITLGDSSPASVSDSKPNDLRYMLVHIPVSKHENQTNISFESPLIVLTLFVLHGETSHHQEQIGEELRYFSFINVAFFDRERLKITVRIV